MDVLVRIKQLVYVIKSFSYSGTLIYTKGKFEEGDEVFYVLISAKVDTVGD